MKTKICTKCKQKKPSFAFQVDKRRTDGYGSWCVPCCVANKRKYKIPVKHYNKMLKDQKGLCFICGSTNTKGNKLNIDHNHKTGKIRGLLCLKCNLALGLVNDDIDILLAMVSYLKVK